MLLLAINQVSHVSAATGYSVYTVADTQHPQTVNDAIIVIEAKRGSDHFFPLFANISIIEW